MQLYLISLNHIRASYQEGFNELFCLKDHPQISGWDAFIQWALDHIRTFRPNNMLAETEDGLNPEHPPQPPTSIDGAATVQSPENQNGSGATIVPMEVVKGQGGVSL